MDAVVHTAAIPDPAHHAPHVVFHNNVMAGFNVVEACVRWGVGRLVNLSSETVPGLIFAERPFLPPYVPIDEETPVAPQDPYGFGKHVIEQWCDAAVRRSDISIVSIRPSWVQHPGNYERNVGPMVRQPFEFSPAFWAYTDNDDLADAIRLAAEVELDGHEVVYIAQPDNATGRPLAELMATGAARRRHGGAAHRPARRVGDRLEQGPAPARVAAHPQLAGRPRRGRPPPLTGHRRVTTSAS